MKLKWFLILILVSFISYFHIFSPGHNLALHVLHQQLFFIPIILASFWFRRIYGIIVSCVVSAAYAITMLSGDIQGIRLAVNIQVALYIGVAVLIGWLTEKLHSQQEKILRDERRASLNRVVSTLSFELRDIVSSLNKKYSNFKGMERRNDSFELKQEIDRLERIMHSFSLIVPPDEQPHLSHDLNQVVKLIQKKNIVKAEKCGVKIKADLDKAGCPSMVFIEPMIDIFQSLVTNALDVSPKGSTILLRTRRTGLFCSLEVVDDGPGISDENLPKLFTPFFTTKKDGFGLALSAGRKVMRDYEGDLLYEPREAGGAIFRMIVPRENRDHNIATYVDDAILKSKK